MNRNCAVCQCGHGVKTDSCPFFFFFSFQVIQTDVIWSDQLLCLSFGPWARELCMESYGTAGVIIRYEKGKAKYAKGVITQFLWQQSSFVHGEISPLYPLQCLWAEALCCAPLHDRGQYSIWRIFRSSKLERHCQALPSAKPGNKGGRFFGCFC